LKVFCTKKGGEEKEAVVDETINDHCNFLYNFVTQLWTGTFCASGS
jgi:hypothetical protein